jgi:hypothetical protein
MVSSPSSLWDVSEAMVAGEVDDLREGIERYGCWVSHFIVQWGSRQRS